MRLTIADTFCPGETVTSVAIFKNRGQVVGKQVVVEEGGVEVGGVDKGAAAPLYKMFIW